VPSVSACAFSQECQWLKLRLVVRTFLACYQMCVLKGTVLLTVAVMISVFDMPVLSAVAFELLVLIDVLAWRLHFITSAIVMYFEAKVTIERLQVGLSLPLCLLL
jgi:hypothetical protein